MKKTQAGFSSIVLLITIVVLVAGGFGIYKWVEKNQCTDGCGKTWGISKELIRDENKLTCTDTDNGDDYYTQGIVNYSEPMTVVNTRIARVTGPINATMRLGTTSREIAEGQTYSYSEKDQVYYQKANGTNGSVLVDMPTQVAVRQINFVRPDDVNNSVDVVLSHTVTDQCVGNVLIENSCVRGINTGYVCPKGCNQGACVR